MKSKNLIFALLVLTAIMISACTINLKTVINEDGSGLFTYEYSFTEEDISSLSSMGYNSIEDFCQDMASDMPSNTVMSIEESDNDTYCILSAPFATFQELETNYESSDGVVVNRLEIVDNMLYYDISADTGTGELSDSGVGTNWILVLPGNIQSHNADTQDGNELTWVLGVNTNLRMTAVSKLGGFSLPEGWETYLAIAIGCLCCLIIIVVIAIVVVVVMRKRRPAPTSTPASPSNFNQL